MTKGPIEEWGGDKAVEKARRQMQVGPTLARLLAILDLSGSMASQDAGEFGNSRRVDVLEEALKKLVDTFPNQVAAIGFNTDAFPVKPSTTLEPTGCTNLYKALQAAQVQALAVKNVVLVSDGQPTDGRMQESKDLVASWKAQGVRFSVIYCGPEGGRGEAFLQGLAAVGGGDYSRCQVKSHLLVRALTTALLEGPQGGAIRL